MRFGMHLLAFGLATALLGAPSLGDTITINNLSQDKAAEAAAGITITPTGPQNLAVLQGMPEVLGITDPALNGATASHYYSATAKLENSADLITLIVGRENDSGWDTRITLNGYDQGKKVASTTVVLPPVGEQAEVTISAPAINSISWSGNGWVFHPYFVSGMDVSVASAGSVTSGQTIAPAVGTSLPEPGTLGILALVTGGGLLLRRGRSD